ncbi:relaxase/mobilization nuclease domain-containing protein [Nostoc flagelliforme FACHB-838]|uniref:Relaxase/mobilization nuclease domain-containing protein n=1 Tax=Nostoc flagelliforme FACHB-838 TaxID=2692904 RepID=A0ABR8DX31_9NOSO|nr:relaxase/mobilization nuclease domain-containing protein [Nostoc flagelliforme]MBD2533986.1 relaxase/mobilization nuclease domain-containing protein [Nostoc flagelliforme FACHB-838]
MITKVKANKSFRGTTKYVLEKEKAKIIGGNMYGKSTNQLVEQFTLSAHLNSQLKDPCYHLMLSVPKNDRTLKDDELANLSQRHLASVIVLSRLQGDESQVKQPEKRISDTKLRQLIDDFIETELPAYDFFIARHSDKEHDHTHIVASRVNNLDGKSIRTWNNYAHSEHSARLLEREFQLTPVQSSWESKQKAMTRNQLERVERDGLPGEEIMRRAIEQVAVDKPTMPQLIEQLWREHQVKAIVSYYGHGGVRGIKFGIDIGSVNEDGSPRLLWKQGGNLNKYKCSFGKLQTELGINYDPKRDDSEIKRLNSSLESVDNNQVHQQLISIISPKKAQHLAETKHQINPAKLDAEQRANSELINTISDFIEQSAVDDTLSETLPQLAEQLSQYNQQLANNKTTLDDFGSAIADKEQQLLSQRAVDAIAENIEKSVVESALTETVLELTQQLSQYKEQLVIAKTTFNDLNAVLATELQSYLEKRAISSISDYVEQSTVSSALTQTVLELTQQLSQYQQLSAGRTIFDDLEAAIVYLEQLHRSQKPVDAVALNKAQTLATDKRKLTPNQTAELYQYYSADLQNLLVTDRDKEIAKRALIDEKSALEVEEILQASPAGWTQDEARELVLIASNQLATQKSEAEQLLDQKQRQESELLAIAVPIAVELINWQLRESGENSLRFKRATLDKQDRELVFTHDERGEIFRVSVNRKQSGELEYSPINVGEIEREDLMLWQEADRVLQQLIEESERQERKQTKGMSL